MRILHVASEMYPLIKTGGLADVVGALPRALAGDSTVVLPGFPVVLQRLKNKRRLTTIKTLFGHEAQLLSGKSETGVSIIVVDSPDLFGFDGDPYAQDENGLRFAVFSHVAAQIAQGIGRRKAYDVVHAHDWQAGLTAAFLKADGASIRTVFTIHNLAFQGVFPREVFDGTGLPRTMWDEVEYWEQLSTLKAGIVYSDKVTTVSPTYALEIQTDEFGMGFGGLLRAHSDTLHGVINGIDPDVWNPATDAAIAENFSATDVSGKAACKRALQDHFGLAPDAKGPLFCVISRLTEQKGLDLVPPMLDGIVARGGQFVLLGSGDAAIEQAFRQARERHPTQVGVTIGYDEPLAHQIQAGADAILIPSRFEPCGLTQLCAMAYGTIPVVSRTGGLMDTVIGATPAAQQSGVATGISFAPVSAHMLWSAVDQTFTLYADQAAWAKMIANAMDQDFSWSGPARDYAALYSA